MVKKDDQMMSIVPRMSGVDCHPETVGLMLVNVLLSMMVGGETETM